MYPFSIYVQGTLAFLRKDLGPMMLQLVFDKFVMVRIKPFIPHGCKLSTRVANWFRGRKGLKFPIGLDTRHVHVPDESQYVELPSVSKPFETEYSLQLHNAEGAGRHFDLRIRIGDKAVSWAIPMKGTRLRLLRMPKPGEKWMAIRQPDHIVPYMKWEGDIKEGYGKGTVKLLGSGLCDILKIESGHVHLRLYGQIKGDFVLVSTDGTKGLIVPKEVPAGLSWNKPNYTKRPVEFLDVLDAKDRVAENKVDGASAEIVIGEFGNRIFSHRISKRDGKLIEYTDKLPSVRDQVCPEESHTRLRGEVYHRNGVDFTAGLLNSAVDRARLLQKTSGTAKIAIFDVTHHRGIDIRALPYSIRRAIYLPIALRLGPDVSPVEQYHGKSFRTFFQRMIHDRDVPSDGIIIKNLNESFSSTPHIKIKPRDPIDCEVVGVTPGEGKHTGRLGALTVKTPEGIEVQVGTGFKDWQREWIWNNRSRVIGEIAKVQFHVRHGKLTNTGPSFDGWHPDKSEIGLLMYSEIMGVNPYALKHRKVA